METTPLHLQADSCYVCGGKPHADYFTLGNLTSHNYWSNTDAKAYFRKEASKSTPSPSMTAVETLDPREVVYA